MKLRDALYQRFPYQSEKGKLLRERVTTVCQKFLDEGLGDRDAEQKMSSVSEAVFWQQFSEVLLAVQLATAGLVVQHPPAGPDFLVDLGETRLWIEVITPEPTGIPDEWSTHIPGRVVSLPHEAILLRWTAAIKQKAEILLGPKGYLAKGIVAPTDAFVIAVNSRLLRGFGGAFPELSGISQFPFAIEATLAVGPMRLILDRDRLKVMGSDHQYRPLIARPKGKPVAADTFLDPRFSPVSAIWAVDADEMLLLDEPRPMAVVHNPNAKVSVPRGLLPAQSEYVATDAGDVYQVNRHDGLLAPTG